MLIDVNVSETLRRERKRTCQSGRAGADDADAQIEDVFDGHVWIFGLAAGLVL